MQPGTAVHSCSVTALQVPVGCPVQFACQKQPVVLEHAEKDVCAEQATPVVAATPVQTPVSWHPGIRGQSVPGSPAQESGVPLHVPVAT